MNIAASILSVRHDDRNQQKFAGDTFVVCDKY